MTADRFEQLTLAANEGTHEMMKILGLVIGTNITEDQHGDLVCAVYEVLEKMVPRTDGGEWYAAGR